MSCMYFHRPHRDPDDSTESSDSITYWRKLLLSPGAAVDPCSAPPRSSFRTTLEASAQPPLATLIWPFSLNR
jgi:hypothetical protein